METYSDYTTVTSGAIYAPDSKLRRVRVAVDSLPLLKRLWERRAVLVSLVIVIAACYAAVCIKANTEFDTSALVTLPMAARDRPSYLIGSLLANNLLARSEARLSIKAADFRRLKLTIQADPETNDVDIRASAPSSAMAIKLADEAADLAVADDRAEWVKSMAAGVAVSSEETQPVAEVVHTAGSDSEAAPQTHLYWDSARMKSAAPWALALTVVACGLLLFAPTPRLRRRPTENVFHFVSPPGFSGKGLPHIELPSLASILLAPDFTREYASTMRPVITDIHPALMVWLTGHIAGGSQPDAANATNRYAREFLLTRGMDNTPGGRGAALAIGRALARRGIATAILDVDFSSSSSQREELGIPEELPGAWEILTEDRRLEDCLLEDDAVPCLFAIPAGRCHGVSAQATDTVLESGQLLDLLDSLASVAKVVLIHGPAVSAGTMTIAKRVDASLLAVEPDGSDIAKEADQYACASLRDAEANIIGTIDICQDTVSLVAAR